MSKFFKALMILTVLVVWGCSQEKSTKAVYFFTQPGCIHCEHAREYINRYYADYHIEDINIREENNMGKLLYFVKKLKISGDSIGTPFIVIGDHYILGWGDEQVKQFNKYMKNVVHSSQNKK